MKQIQDILNELTRDQAAILLGLTPAGVDQLRRVGRKDKLTGEYYKLKTCRKGRYKLEDVLRFKKEKDLLFLLS